MSKFSYLIDADTLLQIKLNIKDAIERLQCVGCNSLREDLEYLTNLLDNTKEDLNDNK